MSQRSWGTWTLGLLLLSQAGCGPGELVSPGGDTSGNSPGQETAEPVALAGEVQAFKPLPRRTITLYFPSAHSNGLVPEEAEIFETASPVDRAKQIISDLISGPNEEYALHCLPPGTRLRQVYLLDEGIAFADFSGELTSTIGGGSSREIMAVYAIVDSLALNIPEIRRVGILIDGRPIESLNGHMDLSRPLPPDLSLIEQPGASDESEWDENRIVQAELPGIQGPIE